MVFFLELHHLWSLQRVEKRFSSQHIRVKKNQTQKMAVLAETSIVQIYISAYSSNLRRTDALSYITAV